MVHVVEFAGPAVRPLRKMDRTVVRRIRAELAALAEETRPERYVKHLKGQKNPP
jgi:mRNA-degrading endonuclease RelE of RelBE toxin-antitoxin system